MHLRSGYFCREGERYAFFGLDLDYQIVWRDMVARLAEETVRDLLKRDGDLGTFAREPLAAAQIERNLGPAPIIDEELHRGEGLDVGLARDAGLLPIPRH